MCNFYSLLQELFNSDFQIYKFYKHLIDNINISREHQIEKS